MKSPSELRILADKVHTRMVTGTGDCRDEIGYIAEALQRVQDEAIEARLPSEAEFKKFWEEFAFYGRFDGNHVWRWLRANMKAHDEK